MTKNNDDLTNSFIALEKFFQAENGTPQTNKPDIFLTLIKKYEREFTLFEVPYLFAKIGKNMGRIKRNEFDDIKRNWE